MNARCAGCRSGGGLPGLHHQDLRPEKRVRAVQLQRKSGGCGRFELLGEHRQQVKQKLKECRRLSQEEYIRMIKSSRERWPLLQPFSQSAGQPPDLCPLLSQRRQNPQLLHQPYQVSLTPQLCNLAVFQ
ncbi:MAG: hypothetical protein LUQ44_04915, partial [Methanothrix sp.]|nr:hypothetical protein [Methanothrix sp.]